MFKRASKAVCVLISGVIIAWCLTAKARDYECSFELSDGIQSIRSVTLSEDVYRCLRFNSYADIAVVNADNQLVPFTLSRPTVNVNRQQYTKNIEFYQEPQVSSYKTGDQIRRIASLTGVVSNTRNNQQWQKTNVYYSSVILEQPERSVDQIGDPLLSVSLGVNTSDAPIRATVLVEVSNDLQNWKALSKPYDFYFLPGKKNNLSHNVLPLSHYLNRQAKYLRLATLSNVQGFTSLISNISGVYQHTERVSQAIEWLTVTPYKLEGEEGVWQFDLPSLVPVSALRLNNVNNIVYYQGQLFSQPHKNPQAVNEIVKKSGKKKLKEAIKDAAKGKSRKSKTDTPWRTVTRFSWYKLMTENGSVESPDLQFSSVKSRQWKIKFYVPEDLPVNQLPIVEVGWKPSTLNFIAQGEGPFTLQVGRDQATKKTVFPAQLQRLGASSESVTILRRVTLEANVVMPSQMEEADSSKVNWGEILLWVILLLGVLLMFYMAYSLMRSMNKEQ